jgi:heavy metal translocating P-type ATPase
MRWQNPRETTIAALAAAGILLHGILRFTAHPARDIPLYLVLAAGGLPLLAALIRKLAAREFGSDLLAGMSIVTAVLLREYLVGAIVVLMLAGGAALEAYASRRASSVLDALARRMPHFAHRKMESGISDVSIDAVHIGDSLVVFPHELCPVDGVVIEGHGIMDESYLTGEPFQIAKTPGSQVLSGAINGDTALVIQAGKLAADSRYARIMQVMQMSEHRRPRLRRLGDRIGAWYTPLALAVAAAGWIASGDPQRFLAVMVIATPCPLLLAIPVAVIGAISLAASRGIIIKNPVVLERVDRCRTLIFDKTGTLTYGRPALTGVICADGFTREQVLGYAASLERYSKHPLAAAVIAAAERLPARTVGSIRETPGEGLQGEVDGSTVAITGRNRLAPGSVSMPPPASGLECLVFIDRRLAGALHFHDAPRSDSHSFIRHLGKRHGVSRVLLVSGDRASEVQYLAQTVGISEVHAGKSPEEKVAIVRYEAARAQTLFVGDGINDAPALMEATVGVALGQASDITSEAADAVILEPSLRKVDELMHIGRRMRTIALQSAVGGMALSGVGMILAAYGFLPPLAGAVAQEVIDLAAVLNAVRVALPFEDLTDF